MITLFILLSIRHLVKNNTTTKKVLDAFKAVVIKRAV